MRRCATGADTETLREMETMPAPGASTTGASADWPETSESGLAHGLGETSAALPAKPADTGAGACPGESTRSTVKAARTSLAAVPEPARQAMPARSTGSFAAARTKSRVTLVPVRTMDVVSATTDGGGDAPLPGGGVPVADADGKAPSAEAVPVSVCDHDGVTEPVRVPDVVAVTGDLDTVGVGDSLTEGDDETESEADDEPVDDDVDDDDPVEDDDTVSEAFGDDEDDVELEALVASDGEVVDDCEGVSVLAALCEFVSLRETSAV